MPKRGTLPGSSTLPTSPSRRRGNQKISRTASAPAINWLDRNHLHNRWARRAWIPHSPRARLYWCVGRLGPVLFLYRHLIQAAPGYNVPGRRGHWGRTGRLSDVVASGRQFAAGVVVDWIRGSRGRDLSGPGWGTNSRLNREIKCCSDPPVNAFSYAALGAAAAANAGTLLFGAVREVVTFRR